MRIGINALSVTPGFTGGGTIYILELIKHLSQIDCHNDYFVFIRSGSKHHFGIEGSNFKFVSVRMPPLFSIAFRVLADHLTIPLLARRHKLDVLFCPGDAIPFWVPCASVMLIQNLLYFHHREILPLYKKRKRFRVRMRMRFWYYRSIALRSALKVDRIITVSENAKLEIMESFGIEDSKISVVYHGLDSKFKEGFIDQERIKSTLMNYNLQPGYLFYVGTTAPHKNIGNLIKSLSILKNQHSISCQLVIAGPDHSGSIPYLRSIAETLGVSEQIVFLGYIPHEELPFLYRGAKIFALLSLCESFGLPVLEAMACGCPVVCSNVSSLPEIAGNAAVLVDPKDPANVADMIRVLFENEEYREHMIALGKRRAQEFSWTRTADQIVSIIEQAARN